MYEQAIAVNSISDNLLGLGMILIAFVITFVIVSGYSDAIAGLGAGAFFSALTATILLPLGFIGFKIYQMMLLILGVSIFLSILIRKKAG